MSEDHRPLGCSGFVVLAMFIGFGAMALWAFTGFVTTDREVEVPPDPHIHAQLVHAKDKKLTITRISLRRTGVPLEGDWSVKEVGHESVVFAGRSGLLTIRTEAIVGFEVWVPDRGLVPAAAGLQVEE